MDLTRLLLVAVLTVAVVLGLIALLNARDRRRAAVLETMWRLAPRRLRDVIAIEAHSALLSATSVVAVDMSWGCAGDEIWDAVVCWRAGLPPGVRLLVNGRVSPGLLARVSVDIAESPYDLDLESPGIPVWPCRHPAERSVDTS